MGGIYPGEGKNRLKGEGGIKVPLLNIYLNQEEEQDEEVNSGQQRRYVSITEHTVHIYI